ncbi:tektin-3 [Folsomia candida]|uniref:tektin-3 n=1 Tax=Folsomia candida TaxID=158441 RepID=UPI000B90009C|nr:tektin-3 [Folsomia candida]
MYCSNACNLPYSDVNKIDQGPRTKSCGWNGECRGEGWISKTDRCSRPGVTSLLRTLPWRHSLVQKPPETSLYSGMSKEYCMYDSGYAGDGCPTEPLKFPNLVTGFNVNAAHASRTALYTRYSPSDWQANNQQTYTGSDCTRNTSELVRAEALRLVRETDDRSSRGQMDSSKKLGDRLADINYWKQEIMKELDVNVHESHKLLETRQTLERMIKELDGPLHIAQENLYAREARQGVDLVHDAAEQALLCEIETIRAWQQKLCQQLDGINTHLARGRAARHELERDLQRKEQAFQIDTGAAQLNNNSKDIAFHSGIEKIDPTVSIPETWAGFTEALLKRSKAERATSQKVHAMIDNLLVQAANETWAAWNNTNNAFALRIAELLDAKNKIACHLSKVQQEIYDMEKHMDIIRKSIEDKAPSLKVAQTRLERRTHRPDIELCRDEAQFRLVSEIQDVNETLEQLQRKLGEVEAAHQQLLKVKACLEHDLKIKANSLFIDREKCLGLRKSFPITTFVTQRQTC